MSTDSMLSNSRNRAVSLQGLLLSTLFVAGLVSLFSYLPFDWWLSDLFTHFRLQYCLFFATTALLLVFCQRWWWAVTALLLFCLNVTEIVPRWLTTPAPAPNQAEPLRLMVFNVNTRGDPVKALRVIEDVQPDIVLLLEIDQQWLASLAPLNRKLPFQMTRPRTDNFGIALFSRFAMEAQIVRFGSAQLPSIRAFVDVRGQTLQLWGTHPPPPIGPTMSAWRDEQLAVLAQHIQAQPLSIMAGDFNTTPYGKTFKALLSTTGLHDASSGFGIQGTWPLAWNILSIPIDHVLHTTDIVTTDKQVLWKTGSDHGALVVDLLVPAVANPG
jgi:endonuclease/exonuclease/phosphatase (EEP) superfamily protein YafD